MNIVITWPKDRTLESYLGELRNAKAQGLQINYRVSQAPDVQRGDRCYMVHDGFVRGWNEILGVERRDDVTDPVTRRRMTPGLFVIRDPEWHPCKTPQRMAGFRGFRYYPGDR